MIAKKFTINCAVGLHARPASVLVDEAGKYKSDILMKHNTKQMSVKSIIGVMALGVKSGDDVELIVNGEDENSAMERLTTFFEQEIQSL